MTGAPSYSRDGLLLLLPKDKLDRDAAAAMVRLGYPAVEPVLPEILAWMQDLNWPVAQVFRPFLADIGAPLASEVRRVLSTDDAVWKYWLLQAVVLQSPDLALALEPELRELATRKHQPVDEDNEAVREAAIAIVKKFGIAPNVALL